MEGSDGFRGEVGGGDEDMVVSRGEEEEDEQAEDGEVGGDGKGGEHDLKTNGCRAGWGNVWRVVERERTVWRTPRDEDRREERQIRFSKSQTILHSSLIMGRNAKEFNVRVELNLGRDREHMVPG